METCIINDVLNVTLSQAENNAVHAAAWIAPTCQADRNLATLGRAILQEIDKIHRERFQRTGKATPVLVSVEAPPARVDALHVQRERWAQQAARTSPFTLSQCRLLANAAEDEGHAEALLAMALASERSPEAILGTIETMKKKL